MGLKRNDDIATPKGEWGTPGLLFETISKELGPFDVDLAASDENTKCDLYFDKEQDSLKQNWKEFPKGFLNPDYGKGIIDMFMAKCVAETQTSRNRVVALIPLAGAEKWFQRYVMKCAEIRLIEGRVRYVGYYKNGQQIKQSPSYSSCIAIFDKNLEQFGGRPVLGPTISQKCRGRKVA